MIDTAWFQQCYNTMSLQIDEAQPVFCKIKHGMSPDLISQKTGKLLPVMFDGPYLNGAKINYLFRRYQVNHPEY